MTRQQIGHKNHQSKGEIPLVSGVLQRAAVRPVADKEGEATQDAESGRLRESRFVHDFSQVPIGREGLPKEVSKTPNQTGLPDNLKAGVENLSGYSLDDVRVHYNSPKPAQLQALAYTQGTEIHVAPGQEEHLPHEAWHVVQQMQGRVKPTMQMKGVQINDDEGLERESDVMGAKSLQLRPSSSAASEVSGAHSEQRGDAGEIGRLNSLSTEPALIQRAIGDKKRLSATGRMEKNRTEKEKKQRRWQLNGKGKYQQSKEEIENAVGSLKALPLYNADRLTRSVAGMNSIWESRFTYEESWINGIGPLVSMVYTELHTMISPFQARSFGNKLVGELKDFAQLLDVARPGQAQQIIGASVDGTYNGHDYHKGTAEDPIPIVFYKQEQHYLDIPKEDDSGKIEKNSSKPYSVLGLPSSKVRFPYVGMKLQDIGRNMPRKMNAKVRRLLVAEEYDLTGTEVDHIHDMGFGGADTTNNLWPLNKDVNQRPNSGAWRTRYLFHYWDSANSQVKRASVNSPGMAKKYYRVKGFGGMEGTGKNDLPTENGEPEAGTA